MAGKHLVLLLPETLRMYPSLPNLIRVCTKPYTIPGTNVLIDKGTPVIIPIYAIHRDPLYYYDPDRFDPERFTDYNKEKRPAYTYLPFGEGPRICIGTWASAHFSEILILKSGLNSTLNHKQIPVNNLLVTYLRY